MRCDAMALPPIYGSEQCVAEFERMSKTRNRGFATFFKQPSEKVSFSSALSVPPIFMRAQAKKLLYKIHKIPLQVALLHLSCVGFSAAPSISS